MERGLKKLKLKFSRSPKAIRLQGVSIPGALDRQQHVSGFDQQEYNRAHVLCIGAGGLISSVGPTLVRKGIGALTILDHDEVEASNLNRQFFYRRDIGKNKAIALAHNLQQECTYRTVVIGHPMSLETAIYKELDLSCDVVLVGVDNNPARALAAKFFRQRGIPVIFAAVSADTDHGYVFIQRSVGPCLGCVLPHVAEDGRFPCPAAAAMSDILRVVGAFAGYAVDAVVTSRVCGWNYRAMYLSSGQWDSSNLACQRRNCKLCCSSGIE